MTATVLPAARSGSIARAVTIIRSGGVVGLPTETVYGLAALPLSASLERLIEIKRRSTDKGIALLIDSVAQVRDIVELPPLAERLAERLWPGPLTLVLRALPGASLPDLLTGGRATVGLRLPDHAVPRAVAREVGPTALTSANVSGQPDATTAAQLVADLGTEVDLVLDDGPVRGGVPSTVVALSEDGSDPVILRLGALSREDVLAAAR